MSEFIDYGQDFGLGGLDKMCDTKFTKRDSLETDAVPPDEAIPQSQKMLRQFQPNLDENSLCRGVNKMQISPQSNGADGNHLAQSEGQNYVSGTNAPDLLQTFMREGEHRGQDVNSRHATAGGAAGGSGNAGEVQSARVTRQESLPLPAEPKVTSVTPRTPQQGQVPYTAIQEATSQPLPKPTSPEAPEEDEHYDVLVLYSEHDQSEAQQFFDIAEKANWKVATADDFLLNQTKFRSFEAVYKNSSYTILLLTSNFITDVWCNHRYQAALTQSIEDPAKTCTVIPIICQYQDFQMPMALSIFTSVKLKNPRIGKILQKSIKVGRRLQREKEAGLTTNDIAPPNHMAIQKPKVEKVNLSMDDIYHQLRPELQPGTAAAHIMSSRCFSKLCVCLDVPDPMNNDWQKLASILGFSSNSGLNQEKSPTAKILECFFQSEIAMKRNKNDILMGLIKVLKLMYREDAAEIITKDGK